MIINKNSWHYKFIKESWVGSEIYKPDPVSLCPYMRRLAYVFLVSVFGYSVLALIPFAIIDTIGYGIMGLIYGFFEPTGMFVISLIISVSIFICAAIFVAGFAGAKTIEFVSGKVTEKQDSIFVEYAKSVHNKVCPNIDYKE
jgi:hypothetical protein